MQLAVNAQVLDIEQGNLEVRLGDCALKGVTLHIVQTTNTFQFTFKAENDVPTVIPKSYAGTHSV